jgi:hypothetical protein
MDGWTELGVIVLLDGFFDLWFWKQMKEDKRGR